METQEIISVNNKKKSKFLKKLKAQSFYQVMVWPGIILMVIFNFIPLYGIIIAFKDYSVLDTISNAEWVGTQYFQEFFSDSMFWTVMSNTIGISFFKLLIGFPSAIILAVLINEIVNKKLKKLVQTISYLPHFLSWVILGGMFITWLSDTGLVNNILLGSGMIDQPIRFLTDPDKYWAIAVISDIWKEVGWNTILYIAAMTGINPSLYEAARMDGATKFQQITRITIPSIRHIIALTFVLSVGGLLGSNLDQTLVLQNPVNYQASEVINSFVYRMGIQQGDFSYATAVGLFVSVISLLLVVGSHLLTKKISDESVF
ncbi:MULTISPECIES: ABC transporter permease [Marinilactibacillus]|uniref:ABC transporter permease n=3 Tax=Marinilactibacillus TaxID=191769 RepID=A0ABW8UJN9_9LACT|nr:carbohydrate ABC transporter membrane protein 1, CUT1 family [Marinilactibacillus piezotolerans]SJN27204.1 ABC-type polysaccharide transport system, permease component [Marinilactibacillus psychrotolerans 42ea]